VVPLRSTEAHLGDRRYSSYTFLTSALEGDERSASRPGRAVPPGKEPPVPTVQETGWAPEPVWTQRLEEKSSASVGDRTPAFQSVENQYTDWDTRLTLYIYTFQNNRISCSTWTTEISSMRRVRNTFFLYRQPNHHHRRHHEYNIHGAEWRVYAADKPVICTATYVCMWLCSKNRRTEPFWTLCGYSFSSHWRG
jgi:hypothetical protein